jgi:integrase
MVIVRDLPALVEKLTGLRLRVPALVALFTGMRLGEVLALRWSRVDLDTKGNPSPRGTGTDQSARYSI